MPQIIKIILANDFKKRNTFIYYNFQIKIGF